MKPLLAISTLVIGLLASEAAVPAEPLRVAVVVNSESEEGNEAVRGIKLAVQQFNLESSGLKLVYADTQGKPATAASQVRTLIDRDGVSLFIGTESPGVQRSVLEVLREKHNVPLISLSLEPPPQDLRDDSTFRIAPNRGHLAVGIDGALKTLKKSELTVIDDQTTELQVAALARTFPVKVTGMSLSNLQTVNSDSAIFVPGFATGRTAIDNDKIIELAQKYSNAPLLLESRIGPVLFSQTGSPIILENVYVISFYSRATQGGRDFYNQFLAVYNQKPLYEIGVRAYAAMQVIGEMLKGLSIENRNDPQAVSNALRGKTFKTVLGELDFRGGGECARLPIAVVRMDSNRSPVYSTQGGAACTCGDEACCSNCCKGKHKSCDKTTSCD